MSLYNMLFGYNPAAGVLLEMLQLSPQDIPRLRDVYLDETGEHIIIFTRTGGGNRDTYDGPNKQTREDGYDGPFNSVIRNLPGFVKDEDDPLDSTYATFTVKVPQEHATTCKVLAAKYPQASFQERYNTMLEQMKKRE